MTYDTESAAINAVELSAVSFHRSGSEQPVLHEISVSIPRGEWVCIAGRNGSGKSTFVRLLNGLLPATSGRILIEGVPLTKETQWELKQRIGIVFANPDDQFVGLTVADDIAFGLENLCLKRETIVERIHRVAEQLELTDLLERHPATLSGGQQQRAAIAAVLAMEPSIIIFDEAASMIDERSKQDLLAMMKQMRSSGEYTLISVTHDTEEMASADRLIVLDHGILVETGTPSELLTQEALLRRCRLQTPYPLQLCRALKLRGIDIGEHVRQQEVLEALWRYHSTKFPSAIETEVTSIIPH